MKAFKVLKTISGRVLKVRSNKKDRCYTIVTESGTYKTYRMSKEEFDNCYYKTGNDWQQFLNGGDYYKVN